MMVASTDRPAMPAIASATKTAFGGEIELRFPYREALVDELKSEVPPRYRRWDADEKCWRVLGAYAPTAITLLLAHFPRADVPQRPVADVRKPKPTPPPAPAAARDGEPAPLVARVACPRCHAVYEQPLTVSAESSAKAAAHAITPELVVTCPSCQALAILAVRPALAVAS